ncbi:MAG: hypothetical protein Q8N99_07060 [Nanoarchaeota archaeon]|nr:hypothetical protein [Nanoarchaeota archaeon]
MTRQIVRKAQSYVDLGNPVLHPITPSTQEYSPPNQKSTSSKLLDNYGKPIKKGFYKKFWSDIVFFVDEYDGIWKYEDYNGNKVDLKIPYVTSLYPLTNEEARESAIESQKRAQFVLGKLEQITQVQQTAQPVPCIPLSFSIL